MKHTTIVGCGGSGGWLVQLFAKSDAAGQKFRLIDGDKWSQSNLVRQFCAPRDIGKYKVNTLAPVLASTGAEVVAAKEYLAYRNRDYKAIADIEGDQAILVAVDNHPARRLCYLLADEIYAKQPDAHLPVISVANEYETASAWVYLPEWCETPLDPRSRWPELLTSSEGDPLAPPCTGEALASAPQLALSNMLSATAGAWLLRFWTQIEPEFRATLSRPAYDQIYQTFPVWVDYTNGRQKTYTVNDVCPREAPPAPKLCATTQSTE